MLGGAAGGARSRPPSDLQQGVSRFPLYSLFPTQSGNRPTLHKVSESLFSTSVSAFGVPTPPPNSPYSPLQLELLNCSQRVLLTDREPNKMEEAKIGKCMPDLCCGEPRQMMDGLGMMQPLTIKTEQAKRACNTCLTNSPKKIMHTDGGCSRTNPVTWLGMAGQNVQVQVKREPQHMHVSELVAVKLEQASPGNKPDHPAIPSSLNNGSIPVGIAVARQRVGDAGLLAALSQKDNQQRIHDIGADATQAAMTVGVANVLCDDRSAPLAWPAPPPAPPPAPIWPYPTAQVSMESMMVGSMGMGGMSNVGGGMSSMGGFQLVREPTSGALLLVPAATELPVVWGGVPYPPAPLLLPPAPHLQLLPPDLLTSATLQHTHTHSTRLVALAPAPQTHLDKRKPIMQPIITPHLIKIEPEPPQEKPVPFVAEPAPAPAYAMYSAESEAAPPTPPPEEAPAPQHRDASNQTDQVDSEDEPPPPEEEAACVGVPAPDPDPRPPVDLSGLELLSNSIEQFERAGPSTPAPAPPPPAALPPLVPLTLDTGPAPKLLPPTKTSPKTPPPPETPTQPPRFEFPPAESTPGDEGKPSLDGLGLLCALAEQRFMEEVDVKPEPETPPPAPAPSAVVPGVERGAERSLERRRRRRRALTASLRRATCGCGAAPCAHARALERDMRQRLRELRRQLRARAAPPPAPQPANKRKVGRPRKLSASDSTETIVAKKPKSKSGLVGFLLAKSPLQAEEEARTSRVRPKLKAEPVLKELDRSASSSMESLNEVRQRNRERVDRLARKHERDDRLARKHERDAPAGPARSRSRSPRAPRSRSRSRSGPEPAPRCSLSAEQLAGCPRVLTAMGGLFYAGRLSAVQAPDVYAITLDGERGNKPHILSREETLRDAILEVCPASARELPAGRRVCAYWSQQYRCLYPGTVVDSDHPDDNFVAVEFDDGDSGTIAIEDIRFLEPDYPVVEYENPLFTLGKRRRNTSVSTEDKKPSTSTSSSSKPSTSETQDEEYRHKERKKLKKHRKEKLKRHSSEDDPTSTEYVKKKKKKHKCCEEHCKHRRHHKKHHRKHRKRHHSSSKEHSSSSEDQPRHKSSSEFADSTKSNEDSIDSNERLSTLIAVEKSPEEKMKTVIKKAVLPKKCLVKTPVLDFSNLGKMTASKDEAEKDNLKDSGIGLEEEAGPSTGDGQKKKSKKRSVSVSSEGGCGVSKMAAFLPGGALWRWRGAPYRRTARPRHRKLFYRAVQRGDEVLHVGDACVFLSTGRADRPYIGRIAALWEARAAMAVRVRWYYHPEETAPAQPLKYPGGLFESPHTDENDVQTISHKCEVLPLAQYQQRLGDDPARYTSVYDNNDVYYRAGRYDPTQQTLHLEPDVPYADAS